MLDRFSFVFRAEVKPDTVDVISECLILDPISFSLDISRNHSFGWHTEQPEIHISGTLAAVKVRSFQNVIFLVGTYYYIEVQFWEMLNITFLIKNLS